MACVTCTVLVGAPHQNDNGIQPELLIELWEGSRATWIIRDLTRANTDKLIEPERPEFIAGDLIDYLGKRVQAVSDRQSIIISPLEGSSVLRQLASFEKLSDYDLHVMHVEYSRVFSEWTNQSTETGRIGHGEISS
jgi:hypothetical protein